MKKALFISSILIGSASLAAAATFHTPAGITSSNSVPYFPLSQLYAGPGSGFETAPPHDSINSAAAGQSTWVTNDPNGAGDYYGGTTTAPILVIDLGSDLLLGEISTWGYSSGNTNGAKDYSLRFATDAEGPGGFGSSITFNPTYEAAFSEILRDSETFAQNVTARYVEMTITDNWRGFQGLTPGGDRVGLGEIAFEVIPEPSTAMLSLMASAFLLRRRRS